MNHRFEHIYRTPAFVNPLWSASLEPTMAYSPSISTALPKKSPGFPSEATSLDISIEYSSLKSSE